MNRIAAMRVIQQVVVNYQDVGLLDETAGAVYDAIDPLIRADEREQKFHDMDGLGMDLLRARKRLTDLRAQVEALQKQAIKVSLKHNDHHLDGEAEAYTTVLALFDGSSE